MIYLRGTKDGKPTSIVILETENLDLLKLGKPAVTPDKSIVLCWTPDAVWLSEKIKESNGDISKIIEAIEESRKLSNRPRGPYYPAEYISFEKGDQHEKH